MKEPGEGNGQDGSTAVSRKGEAAGRGLGEQSFSALLAVLMTAASYGVALVMGPVEVRVGLLPTTFVAPPWYLASVGLPFGLLLAQALIEFRRHRFTWNGLRITFGLVLVGALGGIRWTVPLPTSGHGLIVAYFLASELTELRPGRTWRLAVGCLVLLQAAYFKLYLWHDPASLLVGIGLGLLAWGIERAVVMVRVAKEQEAAERAKRQGG
ncbi:MAG: hypothetical protein FJ109_14400 [Deltaproteobacteria bacterium]|nr:hypothetical protein [Deltaproteobacteria bacterium]